MTTYWLGWAGGAIVIGACWYLANPDHRAKVSAWVKGWFSKS